MADHLTDFLLCLFLIRTSKKNNAILPLSVHLNNRITTQTFTFHQKVCVNSVIFAGFSQLFSILSDLPRQVSLCPCFCKSDRLVQPFASTESLKTFGCDRLSRNSHMIYLVYMIKIQRPEYQHFKWPDLCLFFRHIAHTFSSLPFVFCKIYLYYKKEK